MKLLTILIIALMVVPTASAMTLDTDCNITTGTYREYAYNGSTLMFNNTFTCPSGCANNGLECDSPAQPESFFAFAVVFSLAAFTMAYIALRLNEDYKPLQIMFLAFSVLYIAFVSYVVSGFATLTLNSLNTIIVQSYIMGVFTVVGVVFYFMYLLTRKILEMLLASKKKGRPFKW